MLSLSAARFFLFRFIITFSFVFIVSCTTGSSLFGNPSAAYDSYVDKNVKSKILYDLGRPILNAKALWADAILLKQQREFTPAHFFKYNAEQTQIILALALSVRDSFGAGDFEVLLDGVKSSSVVEQDNLTLVEQHYPFAYPYLRVFLVNFEKVSGGTGHLTIHAPVGKLTLEMGPHQEGSGA